jgi:hypothetical protein
MTIGVIRRLAVRKLRSLGYRRYRSRGDTEYLLGSPGNARRLLAAVEDSRAGKGMRYASIEELRRDLGL